LRSSYAGGLAVTATFSGNTQAGTLDWPASTVDASTALTAIVEVEAVSKEITAMRAFSTLFPMPIEA
jgi:hypothetical protein